MRKLLAALLMSLILAVMLTSVAEVQEERQDVATGDIISFGRYEQDNNTANGAEPIEWLSIRSRTTRASKVLPGRPVVFTPG